MKSLLSFYVTLINKDLTITEQRNKWLGENQLGPTVFKYRYSPMLFVAHLSRVSPLVCAIDELEDFTYTRIQVSSDMNCPYVLIEAKDLVDKSVLYGSLNGQCFFFRFPNLIHCS